MSQSSAPAVSSPNLGRKDAWPTMMRAACAAAGAYAVVGGVVTMLGWYLDIPRLQGWDGHGITMKPNTALCAMAAGSALLVHALTSQKQVVRVLGALLFALAGLTLFEHLMRVDLGIDTLLFDEPADALATASPGRMGPPASVAFMALGAALLSSTGGSRARRFASGLSLIPILIAGLGIAGYIYGASQLYGVARVTGIALQTGTMLAALGVGLTLGVPEHGLGAALRRDDPGGVMLRRLLVPLILLPLAIGWVREFGETAGYYDSAFGSAARSLVEIALFVGLVWWTAGGVTRQARAAREAEQALRDANRRKDEFLATLAHELRNPLAPLNNALEILRANPSEADATRARETMRRQLSHLVRLVDDLLDVSRISRGTVELRVEHVDLATVVQTAIEESQPVLDGFGHQLTVVQPSDPIVVRADVTRLAQVVANLLNNAAKYTAPGGSIRVTLEREADEAVVRVRDNGVGIPSEVLPTVFDMFTRAAKTIHGSLAGLGIGLSLVKQLVELHGGRVEVQSPPAPDADGIQPLGTEFVVRLPVAAAATTAGESASPKLGLASSAPESRSNGQLTIVIADDNVDAAETLGMLFSKMGHITRTVHDGVAALDAVDSVRPDIAILDIGMPGLTGYEVCRKIRAESWGRKIVLVALTGWGQPEDRRSSAEAGFDQHLVKPAGLDQLRDVLDRARGSERRPRATSAIRAVGAE